MPTPLLIGSNEFIYFNEKPIKYNNKIIPKKIKGSQEFNTEFNQVFNQEFYYNKYGERKIRRLLWR